jgi:hypothetical protein
MFCPARHALASPVAEKIFFRSLSRYPNIHIPKVRYSSSTDHQALFFWPSPTSCWSTWLHQLAEQHLGVTLGTASTPPWHKDSKRPGGSPFQVADRKGNTHHCEGILLRRDDPQSSSYLVAADRNRTGRFRQSKPNISCQLYGSK